MKKRISLTILAILIIIGVYIAFSYDTGSTTTGRALTVFAIVCATYFPMFGLWALSEEE